MRPAIRVANLSKRYQIGTRRGGEYRTLRETISDVVTNAWKSSSVRDKQFRSDESNNFWALKDVAFEIQPGEVVGIIGRNGAGKSTLLKVLSRITEPTSGRVELLGRMGSLLEVGTGFHPELTGRENIYLNGSILGMSRREITRRFDEIVDFAEVEKFLDTPVKRYSSGMYVRLAFAVAAHLDPEILIVDEVLAVGDATYQRRCIDRMTMLANAGKTVLFVSHNMDLIPRLCRRAIMLGQGQVLKDGDAGEVVEHYLARTMDETESEELTRRARTGDGRAKFLAVELISPEGNGRVCHSSGEDLVVRVKIDSTCDINDVALAVNINTLSGTRVISGWTREIGFPVVLKTGEQSFQCRFRNVRLRPGHHMIIGLWMESGSVIDHVEEARTIEIVDGEGTSHYSTDRYQGIVLHDYDWTTVRA